MNIISPSSSCYDLMLESLNAICSCSPQVYSSVIDFAWKVLNEKLNRLTQDVDMESNTDRVFKPSNLLISLILAPQYVRNPTSPDLNEFVTKFAMKTSYRQQYDIAVLGFRYGHWKSVSLPLLENISCGRLSTTSHYWISSLIDIASSQMISFDSGKLTLSSSKLSSAGVLFGVSFVLCLLWHSSILGSLSQYKKIIKFRVSVSLYLYSLENYFHFEMFLHFYWW